MPEAAPIQSGEPLCPDCAYDLRGLPTPHRCPECGSAYDEHVRVWRSRRRASTPLAAAVILAPGVLVVYHLTTGFLNGRTGGIDTMPEIAFLAAMAWIAVGVLRRGSRVEQIAIAPDGVRIRTLDSDATLPWRPSSRFTLPRARCRLKGGTSTRIGRSRGGMARSIWRRSATPPTRPGRTTIPGRPRRCKAGQPQRHRDTEKKGTGKRKNRRWTRMNADRKRPGHPHRCSSAFIGGDSSLPGQRRPSLIRAAPVRKRLRKSPLESPKTPPAEPRP